eukprot:778476_1
MAAALESGSLEFILLNGNTDDLHDYMSFIVYALGTSSNTSAEAVRQRADIRARIFSDALLPALRGARSVEEAEACIRSLEELTAVPSEIGNFRSHALAFLSDTLRMVSEPGFLRAETEYEENYDGIVSQEFGQATANILVSLGDASPPTESTEDSLKFTRAFTNVITRTVRGSLRGGESDSSEVLITSNDGSLTMAASRIDAPGERSSVRIGDAVLDVPGGLFGNESSVDRTVFVYDRPLFASLGVKDSTLDANEQNSR